MAPRAASDHAWASAIDERIERWRRRQALRVAPDLDRRRRSDEDPLILELLSSPGPSPETDDVIEAIATSRGTWSVSVELGRLLADLVRRFRPTSVLEFGSGQSSLILARALAANGGRRITSIDHEARFSRTAWEAIEKLPGVDARRVEAPLRWSLERWGVQRVYAGCAEVIAARGPHDFLLIDGPQWWYGREATLHLAVPSLAPGALIVLDDAGRHGERAILARWLATYPGLRWVADAPGFPRMGVAVLRWQGDRSAHWQARWTSLVEAPILRLQRFCRGRHAHRPSLTT